MVSHWLDNIKCMVDFLKSSPPETIMGIQNDPRATADSLKREFP